MKLSDEEFYLFKKHQYCDNPKCRHYGEVGGINLQIKTRENGQIYCNGCGIGRPQKPIQVVDPLLRYAQVHKQRNSKGKIEKVSTRIILGDLEHVFATFDDAKRCKTVNTNFIESRNGNFRKDNARLMI